MKTSNGFWQSYIKDLGNLDILVRDCFASNSESVTADIRRFKAIYKSPLIRDETYITFATKIAKCNLESVEGKSMLCCEIETIPYAMNHKRRGYALVICVENYKGNEDMRLFGCEQDARALYEAFSELNFKVRIRRDPTEADIREIIKTYSKNNFQDEDCFVCVVTSHGKLGYFCTTDNYEFPLDDLFTPFEKNASLKGKPKLFFIDTCRGDGYPKFKDCFDDLKDKVSSLVYQGKQILSRSFIAQPCEKDCLRAYATSPGMPSFCIPRYGSPYIQSLCEFLRSSGKKDSIQTIVAAATKDVHGQEHFVTINRKRMKFGIVCVSYHTLTGSVFFHD